MLCSPAAPIVLLKPKQPSDLAAEVAKSSPYLGVMLPAAPLHHLLMIAYPHPVVATSGNLSDEPIAIENGEAQERLKDVADIFVLHERAIGDLQTEESYRIETRNGVGDSAPLIQELLADRDKSLGAARIAAKFHNALASWIVTVAQMTDVRDVVLSGGVFQNAYLTERTSALLREHGFRAFTHRQVPANDGGISLGQAVLAG